MQAINIKAIEGYLKNNPKATFTQFRQSCPRIKVSNRHFYTIRKKFSEKKPRQYNRKDSNEPKRQYNRTQPIVYLQIYTSTENIHPEAKELLQDFIKCVNVTRGLRLEMVERQNHSIEVRERK